jgi:chalcone isomerase-like protein
MKKSVCLCQLLAGLSLFLSLNINLAAREIGGIKLQEQITVEAIDNVLKLNGAGIRTKFFFKIYVGALYLPEKQNNVEVILKNAKPNRVVMHFLYDEVEKKKLVGAWLEGFKENNTAAVFSAVKDRLETFNQMFSNLHKGDVVLLDYIPGKGTRVMIKGDIKGTIEGADFNRALLLVWLGEEPVTEELKEAMLGLEDD